MLRRSTVFACLGLLMLVGCQGKGENSNAKVSFKVLKEGTSKRTVEKGDAVWAIYTGRLTNGSEFDSNTDPAKLPFFFVVGQKMVIKGWDEGVIGMRVGETRQLTVPPELGYGSVAQQKIPANSTLVFDLTVVGLSKETEGNTYYMEEKKLGSGAEAVDGKMVEVHYVAKYLNGRVLDDTRKRGATVKMKLGVREPTPAQPKAVVGLEDGVRGMKVGGQRRLLLPPNLLFGPGGNVSVSSSQMVEVEVDLISVN